MRKDFSATSYNDEFALVFNRSLSFDERKYVEQIVGWGARTILRAVEGTSFEWPNRKCVVVSNDTTKTYSDDVSHRQCELFSQIESLIKNGSEPRKTNRAGKGTLGTRLVEPVLGADVELLHVWGDQAWDDNTLQSVDIYDLIRRYFREDAPQAPVSSNPNEVFGNPPAPQPQPEMVQIVVTVPKGSTVTITVD